MNLKLRASSEDMIQELDSDALGLSKKSAFHSPQANQLQKEFFEEEPLTELFRRSDVTEVIINGYQNICYEAQGKLHPHTHCFPSPRSFDRFLQRI